MRIKTKRAYDTPAKNDGRRILVDGIWPRGIKKEDLDLDEWMKEIAPSKDLRQWFGHDPEKWEVFKNKYFDELKDKEDLVEKLTDYAGEKTLSLVFAAKDTEHNNAVALKEFLEQKTSN